MDKSSRFAASKLALLDEDVTLCPEHLDHAWARIQDKAGEKPAFRAVWWSWPLAATFATAALLLVTPAGRVWAQTLWNRVLLRQTYNIQIDLTHTAPSLLLPNVFPLCPQDQAIRGAPDSIEAASTFAGFHVQRLTLPDSPRVQVVEPPVIERVVDVAAMRADIHRLGRIMPVLPTGIDGAHIVLEPQGRSVVSSYGTCPELVGPWKACALLVQSRPMVLKLPSILNSSDYTRFSLELAGLPASEVETLVALSTKRPALFLPLETRAEMRSARVRGANGMLIVYPRSVSGEVAYVLDWQQDGFDFRLFGRNPERAIVLAESLR